MLRLVALVYELNFHTDTTGFGSNWTLSQTLGGFGTVEADYLVSTHVGLYVRCRVGWCGI